ncbi:MAG: dTDP-4-dehydrorhamnose reductase [Gammaproteobacteria bacterium]|nr:dTDP-4-dehydrorhamnose reductase [Gammaproteobacteria bacterium]MBQ0838681.1 dTDP-4-dehydrorhamnose reductase [Gammaproteobacteria bacterium]
MTTNILLLGADGQVGWELRRSLLSVGKVSAITRQDCALTDKAALSALVASHKPDIIVNAAAYTAVDLAESESEQAYALNRDLPTLLGELARQRDILVVDYSTDYVFDGSKNTPYIERDPTAPANIYGASKLAGLLALQNSGCRHLVFRVSWVYSSRRGNFIKTILRLAAERDELSIVSDQIGSPTPASLIADVTANCLHLLAAGRGQEGVYQLAPTGQTSWHGLAQEIVCQALALDMPLKLQPDDIKPTPTSGYPTPAQRPANSLMNTDKLTHAFQIHLPDWRQPLIHLLREISAKG